jgi:hypothetical protein
MKPSVLFSDSSLKRDRHTRKQLRRFLEIPSRNLLV